MRQFIDIMEDDEYDGPSCDTGILISRATELATSLGVEILFQVTPYGNSGEVEITDFNAETTGMGHGTRVMNLVCEIADEEGINVYILPSSGRNKTFYARFGFEPSKHRGWGGTMVRYPTLSPEDQEELDAIVAQARRWDQAPS